MLFVHLVEEKMMLKRDEAVGLCLQSMRPPLSKGLQLTFICIFAVNLDLRYRRGVLQLSSGISISDYLQVLESIPPSALPVVPAPAPAPGAAS